MFKHLVSSVVGVAALALAGSASAATYISKLEYREAAGVATVPAYGTVKLEDGLDGGTRVRVTVEFTDPDTLFVETGSKYPFTFKLLDSPNSTVSVVSGVGPDWQALNEGLYKVAAFTSNTNNDNDGTKFNRAIVCCAGNGASNGVLAPMVFDVVNASGITFAGVGAQVDQNGRLVGLGTGNRFTSTSRGWWFTADIWDPNAGTNGATFAVGAKDAFVVNTPVPEPTTWALMIAGFGGAGAVLRRQRRAAMA